MDNRTKDKLRAMGMEEYIRVYYINQSGFAGINKQGTIVDRRDFPSAVPVKQNSIMNIPLSKELINFSDLKCSICEERLYEGYECRCKR